MAIGPLKIRNRGYLPHWEVPGGTYSVTFRLADSLPQTVLDQIRRERDAIPETAAQMGRSLTEQEIARLDELYSERIQDYLDQGVGTCHLRNSRVGQMVLEALQFFHDDRYVLHACCVMPNHVHVLFSPQNQHTLDSIMHSLKSYTANQANRILARRGTFWMPEYYDHLIRDLEDFWHAWKYIMSSPLKAHLENWTWVMCTLEPSIGGQDVRVT